MKIAILQGAFLPVPPALGGAVEKRWFALGKEFVQRGHEVVHVSRKYQNMPEEEWIDGVLHKRVKGYATPSSGVYLKWLDLLYTLRASSVVPSDIDVIVTNTFWAPIILSSKLKRRCMVDVARMPKGQMRLYKNAARLRANSGPVGEAIRLELPKAQHPRVVVIPNPLPFQDLPMVNLEKKQPILLYVGRVHPEKGLDLLINAFGKIASGWRLRIIGPSETDAGGGGVSYLRSLRRLCDADKVDFLGPVYDMEQLNQYYAEASVFVYPSVAEQGETFGLAPLEAMAWGCVPVVSSLACFRDFIAHEKNGLIFDHRNKDPAELLRHAISRLERDTTFRLKLAEEALLVRQSHSTSIIASFFLEEFKCIIREQRKNILEAS